MRCKPASSKHIDRNIDTVKSLTSRLFDNPVNTQMTMRDHNAYVTLEGYPRCMEFRVGDAGRLVELAL